MVLKKLEGMLLYFDDVRFSLLFLFLFLCMWQQNSVLSLLIVLLLLQMRAVNLFVVSEPAVLDNNGGDGGDCYYFCRSSWIWYYFRCFTKEISPVSTCITVRQWKALQFFFSILNVIHDSIFQQINKFIKHNRCRWSKTIYTPFVVLRKYPVVDHTKMEFFIQFCLYYICIHT